MAFVPKEFHDNAEPYITAQFLNDLQDFLVETNEGLLTSEKPLVDDTASNYTFANNDRTTLTEDDFPLRVLIRASKNSVNSDTFTYKYNGGQSSISGYIYDMSTKGNIKENVILKDYIYELFITSESEDDSTVYKAYAFLDAGYLKYGLDGGKFNTLNQYPTQTTRLNYNGYMYATRFYGAVYNPASADFAEGYPVVGDCKPGDVIAIEPDGTFKKNDIDCNERILGIVSDEFAMLVGTEFGKTPIAECGRVHANVRGYCSAGDYLCAEGDHLIACANDSVGIVVAQALEPKFTEGIEKILVRINKR